MLDPIGQTVGYFQLSADYLYLSTLYLLAFALVLVQYADTLPGVVILPTIFLSWSFLCCGLALALVLAVTRMPNPAPVVGNAAGPVAPRPHEDRSPASDITSDSEPMR